MWVWLSDQYFDISHTVFYGNSRGKNMSSQRFRWGQLQLAVLSFFVGTLQRDRSGCKRLANFYVEAAPFA